LVLSVGITKGNSEEAFKRGDLVKVEEEFVTQRYVASPIETRGLQVMPDPVTGQLTVWSSTQTAHVLQMLMAVSLRMPPESIRVVACDVGGGFGQKGVQSAGHAGCLRRARTRAAGTLGGEPQRKPQRGSARARPDPPHCTGGHARRSPCGAARRGGDELGRVQLSRPGGGIQLALAPFRPLPRGPS